MQKATKQQSIDLELKTFGDSVVGLGQQRSQLCRELFGPLGGFFSYILPLSIVIGVIAIITGFVMILLAPVKTAEHSQVFRQIEQKTGEVIITCPTIKNCFSGIPKAGAETFTN